MPQKPLVITDDDAGDRLLMRMAFEEAGLNVNVTEFQNGAELIFYLENGCKTNPPCLVLLDLNMPKVSGFDVLEFRSTHPDTCQVPIIVFTTSTDEKDRARCMELGATDFISKPNDYYGYLDFAKQITQYTQHC